LSAYLKFMRMSYEKMLLINFLALFEVLKFFNP